MDFLFFFFFSETRGEKRLNLSRTSADRGGWLTQTVIVDLDSINSFPSLAQFDPQPHLIH